MSIDKEYDHVFNKLSKAVDGEPIPEIISGALNLIGAMLRSEEHTSELQSH